MPLVFDDSLSVHYSQAFVVSGDEGPDPVRAFAGQANGLCGARVPGSRSPAEADRLVRQTSRIAAYWHEEGFNH